MSKKACKKKTFENKENAKYICKKCGAKVNKEKKVCKPRRLNAVDIPKSVDSHNSF